eukprot:211807_1
MSHCFVESTSPFEGNVARTNEDHAMSSWFNRPGLHRNDVVSLNDLKWAEYYRHQNGVVSYHYQQKEESTLSLWLNRHGLNDDVLSALHQNDVVSLNDLKWVETEEDIKEFVRGLGIKSFIMKKKLMNAIKQFQNETKNGEEAQKDDLCDHKVEPLDHEGKVNANQLQIARNEIECWCQKCNLNNDDKLYFCKDKQCENRIFCKECGPFDHRGNSGKNHAWISKQGRCEFKIKNSISINALLSPNCSQMKLGKEHLVKAIGDARYNQISPFVTIASSVIPMNGIHKMFENMWSLVLNMDAANAFAHNSDYPWINDFFKEILNDCVESGNYKPLTKWIPFRPVVSTVQSSIGENLRYSAPTMIVWTGFQLAATGYQWYAGKIDSMQFVKRIGRVVTHNSAAWIGAGVGMKIGGACMLGGPAGVIAGILFGVAAGWTANRIYDACFGKEEEIETKRKAVKDALFYFHFSVDDIKNEDVFNTKSLTKKYRTYALEVHPDRTKNKDQKPWNDLSLYYGILTKILESKEKDKELIPTVIQRAVK